MIMFSLRQFQPFQFPELSKEMRFVKLPVWSRPPSACPEIQRTDDSVNLDQYRLYFMHFVEFLVEQALRLSDKLQSAVEPQLVERVLRRWMNSFREQRWATS